MADYGWSGEGLEGYSGGTGGVADGIAPGAAGTTGGGDVGSGISGYTGPAGWAEAMATNYGIANANGTVTGVPGGTVGSSAGFPTGPDSGYYGAPVYDGRSGIAGWIARQVEQVKNNPIQTLINTIASFTPLGIPNTISGILGGPTIGGGLTALGQSMGNSFTGYNGSQDADGDGVIGVGDDFANYGGNDSNGWESSLSADIDAASVSSDPTINELLGLTTGSSRSNPEAITPMGTKRDAPREFRVNKFFAPSGLDYYRYGFGPEATFYGPDNQQRLS